MNRDEAEVVNKGLLKALQCLLANYLALRHCDSVRRPYRTVEPCVRYAEQALADSNRDSDGICHTTSEMFDKPCKHIGWFHRVRFLCFVRKFLACEKCGELIPQGRWKLD